VSAELAGTPAVGVMTTAFVDAAELMARVRHMPDYGFAVIDHPISNATDAELRRQAERAVRRAEELLFTR
jgi:hypothetical protein